MRVYFTNLGCKLNQAEMEALARSFADAGRRAFWTECIGDRVHVLWEHEHEDRWLGTTDHYVRVRAAGGGAAVEPGLGWARLTALDGDVVEAEPLSDSGMDAATA